MPIKTYYGKLDCSSSAGSSANTTNEFYRSFCDFMSYLTASNVANLIAWNSGSGVVSASFNQRGYYNQSNLFGGGAHSVWQFPSSSTRPFDWYLYMQVSSGNYAQQIRQSFNVPISGFGAGSDNVGGQGPGELIMQAAVCFSGTTSFNPWNGTGPMDGQSTAGNPRWVSGANDRSLAVFPRSNDFGGTALHIAQKSNSITFGPLMSGATTLRWHFIFDGDALVCFGDIAQTGAYHITYVGPFELRSSLTSSGICNGPFGMAMYGSLAAQPVVPVQAAVFGDTAGTTQTQNGGIYLPTSINPHLTSSYPSYYDGTKGGILNTVSTFSAVAYQTSSYTGKLDEFPIYVAASELPFIGLVGTLNVGLVRYAMSASSNSNTADNSRAVFGSTTLAALKTITAWTGSTAPGQITSRTGSNYTWSRNYDI
jgi:hypothetical protein